MIVLAKGLQISTKILNILKKDKEFAKKYDIYVGCFTNCREVGHTFIVESNDPGGFFTFCVYEHRNSDSIIINGKPGYITTLGDLPYMADSKYIYIDSFGPDEIFEAAETLKDLIKHKIDTKNEPKEEEKFVTVESKSK